MKLKTLVLSLCSASALAFAAHAESITIATVNNGDMIRMQKLTDDFTSKNPDIQLNWVTLEENVLRERVTTDIATKGGQYDVMTIGTYEVPIWAKQSWLLPLDGLGADYDAADIIPAIAGGLSVDGKLYAAPFYGESLLRHVPQGPDGEGGADHARRADLGIHRRRGAQDDRPRRRHQRHLPARQGRLGREHGVPDRHVELVRRALVRRELEAAVRPARMEEHAAVLCRPDEGRRPGRRFVQRLQRESGAVPAGQVRHVDRRHRGGILRVQPEGFAPSPTRSATRWRPTPVSASAATGCGPGRWRSRPARRRPTRPRSSCRGRPASPISTSSRRRKAGPTFLRERAPRSTTTPSTRRQRPSRR